MARIELTLYSQVDGAPLTGNAGDMSFNQIIRYNADGSTTDLSSSANDWEETPASSGFYVNDVPDALLTPGSQIRYIADAGVDATARFYDGVIDASGPQTFGTMTLARTQIEVVLRKGDRAPSMVLQLLDASGNPVNLSSGSPSVVFNMRSDQGGSLVVAAGAVTIVDAAIGQVLYAWAAAATLAAGNFFFELVLTQGGLESTYPWARSGVVRVIERV